MLLAYEMVVSFFPVDMWSYYFLPMGYERLRYGLVGSSFEHYCLTISERCECISGSWWVYNVSWFCYFQPTTGWLRSRLRCSCSEMARQWGFAEATANAGCPCLLVESHGNIIHQFKLATILKIIIYINMTWPWHPAACYLFTFGPSPVSSPFLFALVFGMVGWLVDLRMLFSGVVPQPDQLVLDA